MTDREIELMRSFHVTVSQKSKLDVVQLLSSELSNDLPHFNPSSVFIIIYTYVHGATWDSSPSVQVTCMMLMNYHERKKFRGGNIFAIYAGTTTPRKYSPRNIPMF